LHFQFLMQMRISTLLRPWHRVRMIVTFFWALGRQNKQKSEPSASQGQNLMDWSVELVACAFENNRTTVDPQSTGPDPNYDWRAFVLPRSAANRHTIKHALCRKQSG
jgi:hypothetical protein